MIVGLALAVMGCAEDDSTTLSDEGTETTEEETEGAEEEGDEAAEEEGDEAAEEEGDEAAEEEGDEAAVEETGDTIVYSGTTQDWLSLAPGADFTVCVYDTETCTTLDDEGNFALEGVPANAEVLLTFVREEDNSNIAFPITTGDEDMSGPRPFTVVGRPTADLMLQVGGEVDGVDDSLSILTFYVGNGGYDTLRGLAGVEVSYDGPDTAKAVKYIVPIAQEPGVFVGDESITATSSTGNGFVPNIAPGDYTLTLTDDARTCEPTFAWAGPEGSDAGTFRTQLIEGYATFTFFDCKTDETVDMTGTLFDLAAGSEEPPGVVAGAEVCVKWGLQEDGTYGESMCENTNEEGLVTHADVPGDTQFLIEGTAEGFMKVVATFETLVEDLGWFGISAAPDFINIAALTAGIEVEKGKGHIIVTVLNADGDNLDGFTVELVDSEIPVNYVSGLIFDEEATATTADGIGTFFNLEPGNYFVDVAKEGVLCTSSSWSWNTANGYAAPAQADAITQIAVVCIAEPTPVYPEPEPAIELPVCDEEDALANCTALCDYFAQCTLGVCPGFTSPNAWETDVVFPETEAGCIALCETLPEVTSLACELTSCNDAIFFTAALNESIIPTCDDGLLSIIELAIARKDNEEFPSSTVVGLIEGSDAVKTALAADGPFTVFLPIDSAFDAENLDPATLEAVLADEALRDQVLTFHAIADGIPASAVVAAIEAGTTTLTTLGGTISLGVNEDGQAVVGGATVVNTDFFGSNGVIHYIDGVILPPAEETEGGETPTEEGGETPTEEGGDDTTEEGGETPTEEGGDDTTEEGGDDAAEEGGDAPTEEEGGDTTEGDGNG